MMNKFFTSFRMIFYPQPAIDNHHSFKYNIIDWQVGCEQTLKLQGLPQGSLFVFIFICYNIL